MVENSYSTSCLDDVCTRKKKVKKFMFGEWLMEN
jgi:hypothetical protein